jgi:hypothetical protein
MTGNYDVFRVRTGLKYGWAREAVAKAVSLCADGTTEHHILRTVDGNKPVRSFKGFVPNESKIAPGHAQQAC